MQSRKVISKACDPCRRRKIKCNGLPPCSGCLSANLTCTFIAPRKQGGNRGARATILNELRASRQHVAAPSPVQEEASLSSDQSAPTTSSFFELRENVIDTCIHAYLNHIYRVVPLLEARMLRTEASQANTSILSRKFIFAFCAYVVSFGKLFDEPNSPYPSLTQIGSAKQFLDAAISVQNVERETQCTPHSVYISFFLYGACTGQGDYRQGWFYLREATTLFMMLREPNPEWYDDRVRRCLFWILVISERAHGVRRNRPITLPVTSTSPALDTTHERGLQYLASVFRPLNEIFFAVWNGSTQECSKDWLLRLEDDVRSALPVVLSVSNEEITNLRVSQFWLRIKVWELFPRFGFLSTESVYECLTFRYPVVVARDLTVLAMKLPIASFQVHGIGMTEKVFDIACACADVLSFVSTPTSQLELGPVDYFIQVTSLLAKLPNGSSKFVPLLVAKVNEMYPELVKTLCEAIDMPLLILNDPMSPDTRYLYEEEVGRGLYTDLRRAR